eukprot:scaffold7438_cov121-Amphora_coffeaeformis.AAC.2
MEWKWNMHELPACINVKNNNNNNNNNNGGKISFGPQSQGRHSSCWFARPVGSSTPTTIL